MRESDKKCVFAGAMLLALAAAGQFAARTFQGFGSWYAVHVYSVIVAAAGRLWGLFPVSVAELGLYGLAAVSVWYGIRRRKQWKAVASRALMVVGLAAFLYTYQCGINYYRRPFSSELALEVRQSSVRELKELCEYLTEKVNETAAEEAYDREWRIWGQQAMSQLGEEYPGLAGYYPRPKPVTVSWILSVQQLSGIYSPFTLEANYNRQMTDYNIPHTICHELSHLNGFMREDEANYIAYLACTGSEDPTLQYSGLLLAYTHSINALYKADYERFVAVREKLCEQAERDYAYHRLYWEQYEGPVSRVSDKVNDTYLRANAQEEGSKSYGRMVDLLLGEYRQRRAGESPAARLVRGS